MNKKIAECGVRNAELLEDGSTEEWPALPTETEIYILPNGEIVVADLPVELVDLIEQFTTKSSAPEITIS